MNNKPRLLPVIWFVLLAVVASCAPRESATPQPASPTSSPSRTARSPATATVPPTDDPHSWNLSPAELADAVVFPGEPPAWLSHPERSLPAVDVLTVAMGSFVLCGPEEPYQLIFLNAETGDQYEMTVPAASGMLWLDSHTFGLFWKAADILLSLDFAEGSVEASSFEAAGIDPLWTTGEVYDEEIYGCTMTGVQQPMHPAAYSAELSLFVDGDSRGSTLDVRDVRTDSLIWSADPDPDPLDDDTYEAEFAWSPVEPSQLAVVECETDTTGTCIRSRLYLVDVARSEEVVAFPGQFMDIAFSPDGHRILYTSPDWDLRSVNMGFSGPPCVLDLATGEHDCVSEIPAAHFPDDLGFEFRWLHGLQWDRGGQGFYYAYEGAYQTPELMYEYPAGLCHFALASREITCPSEDVPELEGAGTIEREGYWPSWFAYNLSPDEGFGYVQATYPYVQEAGGASNAHGVLNLEDRRFFRLPDPPPSACEGAYCFVSALWRPPVGASTGPGPTMVPPAVRTTRPTEQEMGELSSIWASHNLDDQLDFSGPSWQRFSAQVSPDDVFTWPFYWCALGEERLAGNLESIAVEFTIAGVEVPQADVLEFDGTSGEWACHYWATMLSGWQVGSPISLAVTFRLTQSVGDGRDTYPAGDHTFEIVATVRP